MRSPLLAACALLAAAAPARAAGPADYVRAHVHWFGQNSLRVDLAGAVIWIDPVGVTSGQMKADVILLTHDHPDHYSADDVERLRGPATVVLACFDAPGAERVRPGASHAMGPLTIEAVPAYNVRKVQHHPRAKEYCGFVLSGEGLRIYDAGDTERIPEQKTFTADVALLPLGQIYTMDSVDDAVQAALDVKARVAIPVHFGTFEGTDADAAAFLRKLQAAGVEGVRLERGR